MRTYQKLPAAPKKTRFLEVPGHWRNRAACSPEITKLFFDGSGVQAKKICATCPVARHCLDFALKTDEQNGVWGGLGLRARRLVKRALTGLVGDARVEVIDATIAQMRRDNA